MDEDMINYILYARTVIPVFFFCTRVLNTMRFMHYLSKRCNLLHVIIRGTIAVVVSWNMKIIFSRRFCAVIFAQQYNVLINIISCRRRFGRTLYE